MSIKLRLTLIYTAILALTLVIFSVALYHSQARQSLEIYRGQLIERMDFAEFGLRSLDGMQNDDRRRPPPEIENINDRRGPRMYIQIRNIEGALVSNLPLDFPDDFLSPTPIPLNDDTLARVQAGESPFEQVSIEGTPYLLQSKRFEVDETTSIIVQMAIDINDRAEFLELLRTFLLGGSLIAVGLATLVGWLLAGYTLRPIEHLTHTAQVIGTERDFSKRVDYQGPPDELGQLAGTFNTMLSELEGAFRQTSEALETQKRFVSDASHELRTPLTTIRGNISLLRRQPNLDGAERTDILQDTRDETERMIRLVNNLLTLARADNNRQATHQPLNLGDLLTEVCRHSGQLAPTRVINCQVNAATDVTVKGNVDNLKQAFLVLVDNAIKHTPAQAQIAVRARQETKRIIITVQDTGPGIDPENLPYIFERFYQGDSARSGEGTGLGLAIAKEIARQHHGELTVQSTRGKGTTFRFSLPVQGNNTTG